ncbi:hypothetical protein [Marinobacter sp. NFXS9]|uniref:hypothetical protein n=1 Tax=Marinobacter sp. NFXS9 TaxID=2818433 RepID=UPI0032DF991A
MKMNLSCRPDKAHGRDAVPVYVQVGVVERFELFIAGEAVVFAVHWDTKGEQVKLSHYDSGLSISGDIDLSVGRKGNREKAQRLIDRKVGEFGSERFLQRINSVPKVNYPHSTFHGLLGEGEE